MTTPSTPRVSPGYSAVKEKKVEILSPQIDMKAYTPLQTPPRTPQLSALDTEMAED
jgi:hypothetical protein